MGSASTAGKPTNHSFVYWGGVGNKSIYARGYTRAAGTVHTLVTAFLVTACVISTLCYHWNDSCLECLQEIFMIQV